MCLRGLNSKKTKIAEEDIVVLKILAKDKKNILHSPIYSIEIWDIGEEKEANFCIIQDDGLIPHTYYPTFYRTLKGLYSFNRNIDINWCINSMSYVKNTLETYEAVIPKGSIYVNTNNQFCSNKLKIIKKIK